LSATRLWVLNWPIPRISKCTKPGSHIATNLASYDFGHTFAAGPASLSGLVPGGRAYAVPPSAVVEAQARIRLPVLVGTTDMETLDTIALVPNPRGLFVPGVGTWTFDPVPLSPLVGIDSRGKSIAVVSWDASAPSAPRHRWRLTVQCGSNAWRGLRAARGS
jgi:hypothetical protein